jgi:hypothetical protein
MTDTRFVRVHLADALGRAHIVGRTLPLSSRDRQKSRIADFAAPSFQDGRKPSFIASPLSVRFLNGCRVPCGRISGQLLLNRPDFPPKDWGNPPICIGSGEPRWHRDRRESLSWRNTWLSILCRAAAVDRIGRTVRAATNRSSRGSVACASTSRPIRKVIAGSAGSTTKNAANPSCRSPV